MLQAVNAGRTTSTSACIKDQLQVSASVRRLCFAARPCRSCSSVTIIVKRGFLDTFLGNLTRVTPELSEANSCFAQRRSRSGGNKRCAGFRTGKKRKLRNGSGSTEGAITGRFNRGGTVVPFVYGGRRPCASADWWRKTSLAASSARAFVSLQSWKDPA